MTRTRRCVQQGCHTLRSNFSMIGALGQCGDPAARTSLFNLIDQTNAPRSLLDVRSHQNVIVFVVVIHDAYIDVMEDYHTHMCEHVSGLGQLQWSCQLPLKYCSACTAQLCLYQVAKLVVPTVQPGLGHDNPVCSLLYIPVPYL